ncbi:MAG TPA: alanine dehydrogenase [Thermopetrobacter sp.]|nr:alanine dehydrogenase [Thermopetrobacter sp.]
MRIGVPKEIKTQEHRVGMTPAAVREAIHHGHEVLIESGAGAGIGASDGDYRAAGAKIAASAAEVFASAEMIVKVKEPQAVERRMLREGQILFTYLHLAADAELTRELVDSGAVCIAYETVTGPDGSLPLLSPMSQVAGRMAIQAAAHALEKEQGGAGLLIGGVPGVKPARVCVIGGGNVGENAAAMAIGLGADVFILEKSPPRMQTLHRIFGHAVNTVYATRLATEEEVLAADVVIGAVLIPGAKAPKLISRDMVRRMKPGSVIVDVAIDQGGIAETSMPTTHDAPTYVVDEVVHYCVANMPGAVARTSTYALNNATLPYVLAIADRGWPAALAEDEGLLNGLNIAHGKITHEAVARSLNLEYTDPKLFL